MVSNTTEKQALHPARPASNMQALTVLKAEGMDDSRIPEVWDWDLGLAFPVIHLLYSSRTWSWRQTMGRESLPGAGRVLHRHVPWQEGEEGTGRTAATYLAVEQTVNEKDEGSL